MYFIKENKSRAMRKAGWKWEHSRTSFHSGKMTRLHCTAPQCNYTITQLFGDRKQERNIRPWRNSESDGMLAGLWSISSPRLKLLQNQLQFSVAKAWEAVEITAYIAH